MIITLKTLQQQTFKIEVESTDNVKALKQKVQDEKGDEFPADAIKLIYAGKILDNEAPISKYQIKETSFVVIMVTKARPPPTPAAEEESTPVDETEATAETSTAGESSATPQETSTPSESSQPQAQSVTVVTSSTPAATTEEAEGEETEVSMTQTTPIATTTDSADTVGAETSLQADSVLVTGNNYQTAVQGLMELGYTRDETERALEASFNNPDRAAEMLMSGTVPSSDPEVLGSEGGEAVGQQEETGDVPQEAPPVPVNSLAFLRDNHQFQLLRGVVQSSPELLAGMMDQIARSNPQLFQIIHQNQQDFINLINEPNSAESNQAAPPPPSSQSGQGQGQNVLDPMTLGSVAPGTVPPVGNLPPGSMTISVTEQEREAIDRLKALGYPEHLVVQAYFACDKSEQLAANFLLQQNVDDDQ